MFMKNVVTLLSATVLTLASTQLLADSKGMNDDDAILQAVKSKITEVTRVSTVNVPNIVVEVKDAKVILTGTVDTSMQKNDAEKAAKEVSNVKSVDSKIIVKKD